MPLIECTEISGGCDIVAEAASVHRLQNALLIPMGHAHKPGVFAGDGTIFLPAGYFRGVPTRHLPLETEESALPAENIPFAPDGVDYVYAGHLTGHFGHFLFSILSRLWALPTPCPANIKLVLLNGHQAPDMWQFDFARAIFGALGVEITHFATFREPVRFRELLVPDPTIEECLTGRREFAMLCHRIGEHLLQHRPVHRNERPLYLSKHRLTNGIHRVVNEDVFCSALETFGVEVISPESLSFVDQVAIWAERPFVSGMLGSAMHTGIFAGASGYLALNPRQWINSCQLIFDRLNDNSATIVYPDTGYADIGPSADFHHNLALVDPEQTAHEFYEIMQHHLGR